MVEKRKAILVLGMHRSGTSALTRVLNMMGADLPTDLIPPAPDNPKGFWESKSIWELNDRILQHYGSRWYDCYALSGSVEGTSSEDAFIDEISGVLEQQFSRSSLFVIKDPRIGRLFPLWQKALQRFGAEIFILHMFRDPWEVAQSLAKRQECPEDYGCLLWLRYVLDTERHLRNFPHANLSYESLLKDWKLAMGGIAGETGVLFPKPIDQIAKEVDQYLNIEDRHHRSQNSASDGKKQAWWKMAYELLHTLQKAEQGKKKYSDKLSDSFDKIGDQYNTLLKESASEILPILRQFWLIQDGRVSRDKALFQEAYEELVQERNEWAKSQEYLTKERDAWQTAHYELKNYSENTLKEFLTYNTKTHSEFLEFNTKTHDEFLEFNTKTHDEFLEFNTKAHDEFIEFSKDALEEINQFIEAERQAWQGAQGQLLARMKEEADSWRKINEDQIRYMDQQGENWSNSNRELTGLLEQEQANWRKINEDQIRYMDQQGENWSNSNRELTGLLEQEQANWRKITEDMKEYLEKETGNWARSNQELVQFMERERENWRHVQNELAKQIEDLSNDKNLWEQKAGKLERTLSSLVKMKPIRLMLKVGIIKKKYKAFQ